jgi:ribosomal protein S18 acetylase RimI-like enzyme
MDTDAVEVGNVYVEGHTGGICFEKYGAETPEEAVAETMRVLGVYNAKDLSIVIVEQATGKIVGVCTAGIGKHHIFGYSEIADIIVLPQYQGKGLGKYMISHIITQTYGLAPFVRMCVDIGNSSEYLYRQMGFIAGPRCSSMERRN